MDEEIKQEETEGSQSPLRFWLRGDESVGSGAPPQVSLYTLLLVFFFFFVYTLLLKRYAVWALGE